MSAFELSLPGGGTAAVVESDGHHAVVLATRPFAPGTPLDATALDGSGLYRLKVRGSRRIDDTGHYRIEVRWVNISREQRKHLCDRVARGPGRTTRED